MKTTFIKNSFIKHTIWIVLLCSLIACDNDDPTPPQLTDVQVWSNVSEVPIGVRTPLYATAYYSNGDTLDVRESSSWSVSDDDVATIDSRGVMTSIAAGPVVASATFSGITGSVSLTVSPAFIVGIQITPAALNLPIGLTQAYTAIGSYNDGNTHDISAEVTWESTTPSFATVDDTGLAIALSKGVTTITATQDSISSIPSTLNITDEVMTSIEVLPAAAAIAKGLEQSYQAVATYSDASTSDISSTVTWRTSDSLIATINSSAIASGIDHGFVEVTAHTPSLDSDTAYLLVTHALITEIVVTPDVASIAKGTVQQYQAIASFTDGTVQDISDHTKVGWQSSDIDTASIDDTGLARSIAEGSTNIIATLAGKSSEAKALNVTSAVVSTVVVTPSLDFLISKGAEIAYKATATWTDSSTQDVTGFKQVNWLSDNTKAVTVSLSGGATGVSSDVAPALVSATIQGQSGSSRLVGVTCPTLSNNGLEYTCSLEDDAADLFDLGYLSAHLDPNVTGMSHPYFVVMDWSTAESYCRNLNYNGFSDWRLPTSAELVDLFNIYDGESAPPSKLSSIYNWPIEEFYWTSSNGDAAGEHLAVLLSTGLTGSGQDTNVRYAGCVRTSTQP